MGRPRALALKERQAIVKKWARRALKPEKSEPRAESKVSFLLPKITKTLLIPDSIRDLLLANRL